MKEAGEDPITGLTGVQFLRAAPIKRIALYKLLLKELLKHTPEDHPDHAHVQQALEAQLSVNALINDRKRVAEDNLFVGGLHEKVQDSSSRFLLKDSVVERDVHDWRGVTMNLMKSIQNTL